jgi:hypothetical protein
MCRMKSSRHPVRVVLLTILLGCRSSARWHVPEHRPANDGSQYAWGRNGVGQLQPSFGPGVTVADAGVTGRLGRTSVGST